MDWGLDRERWHHLKWHYLPGSVELLLIIIIPNRELYLCLEQLAIYVSPNMISASPSRQRQGAKSAQDHCYRWASKGKHSSFCLFVSLTSSQYPVGWQLLAWLCPALLLSADWRERRTQNGSSVILDSWGGFSKTTGVSEQISNCALFCKPAKRVNTHQLSGLWFGPLPVLTVNPGGGKVNKVHLTTRYGPQSNCSRWFAEFRKVSLDPLGWKI